MANYPLSYPGSEIDALLRQTEGLAPATDESAGLMSSADKVKLDGVAIGAQANVIEGVKLGGANLTPSEKIVDIPMDNAPVAGSSNLISSGAVHSAITYATNSTGGMMKVVAGRRMPKVNWGGVPVRFSVKPTFVIRHDEVIYDGDDPYLQGMCKVYAPIIAALIGRNIISLPQNMEVHGDYFYLNAQDTEYWFEYHNEPLMLRFEYVVAYHNGIRLLSDGTFRPTTIERALTTSPDLVIENGKIKCIATVGADWNYTQNSVLKVSRACIMKYRRTGIQYRRSISGSRVRRKKQWSFVREARGTETLHSNRKARSTSDGNAYIPHYFQRTNRAMIWVRLYAIHKRRWISPIYTEIRKVHFTR